ncbi:MAG: alpha/beta fold hydrolase [Actinobacteria bacterium]|nr:alpha/beta fold hydrolase [Actinomycetota bacterium]
MRLGVVRLAALHLALVASLTLVVAAPAVTPSAPNGLPAPALADKKRCAYVVKTIKGKKKRVRVCRNVPPPKPLPLREQCVTQAERKGVVRFVAGDGTRLLGVMIGSGPRGVALGHESDSDLCSWMPFARKLAAAGLRVLALNHRGHGSSGDARLSANRRRLDLDFAAAVSVLRSRGVDRVFLGGASMGGTGAVVAAAAFPKSVAGVVSVSAPTRFSTLDALAQARKLQVPALYLVAREDEPFATDARALHDASASPDKRLVVTDGASHGTGLLRDAHTAELVTRFVLDRLP